MIIDKNDYFKYIDLNNNITPCQKKMLKYYFDNLNTFYVDKKSNAQTKTLITNCYKNNLVTKIAKIKNLFYTFFNKEFTDELFRKISKEKLSDIDFINWILKNKQKYSNSNKKSKPELKIKSICNSWTYIIELIVINLKKINQFNNINLEKIKYLDIGCGSGNKTNKFAQILNLDYKNVYGADINTWGPYNQKEYTHKFNFAHINNGKIDLDDNSIDFASCILMLHHVQNLEILLSDIKRILKPNGILLVIEHNNYDDYDNLILDLLHMLYGYLYDKNNRYLIEPDYALYYNSFIWDYIMDKNGFKILNSNSLFTELSNEIRYDNLFYSFYLNNK